jgi:hypothetical protein
VCELHPQRWDLPEVEGIRGSFDVALMGIDHEIEVESSMEELDWVREQGVVMNRPRFSAAPIRVPALG